MGITSFTQLTAYQKSDHLRWEVNDATQVYPADERFGLTAQTRTAVASIPQNIAEGFGRRSPKDKARSYNIAMASAEELKDHLRFASQRGFLPDFDRLWRLLEEVCRLLRGLIRKTDEWARTGRPPSSLPRGEPEGGPPS
jgi:four helix bundle protein